jgi:type II secretion system protein N
MSAHSGGPTSQRISPAGAGGAGAGAGTGEGLGAGTGGSGKPPPADRAIDPRLEMLREKAKQYGPYVGYSTFFLFVLFLFAYWTFPYDRVRDRIIADFERNQRTPPGGARQSLSIGSLEPSWFTGVVLKDVSLVSTPADPSKPSSVLHADEIKVRVSFGSLLSANKDLTFSATALGGTISGSVSYVKTQNPTPAKPTDKDKGGTKYDRIVKIELADVALNEVAPLRDAIGAGIAGTMRGSIDLNMGESRLDKANGTVTFDVDGFGLPGENDTDAAEDCKKPDAPKPCESRRVHFKLPALKSVGFFSSDVIALPPVSIGAMPIKITIKNGVARIETAATGRDVEVKVDGQISFRELLGDSDVNVGLAFKFNDSYRKKSASAEGALFALDSDPKLKAGKRPDGFYSLRLAGLLGGSLQVLPAPGGIGGATPLPRPISPMVPMAPAPPVPGGP